MSAWFPGLSVNATARPQPSVRAWILVVGPPRERAALAWTEALTRLDDKEDYGSLRADLQQHFSDTEISAITAAAAEMPSGSSAVYARRGRWLVVRINERELATISDVAPVRNRVLLDYRRNMADTMLLTYIDNLRQRADISVIEL